MEKKYQKELNLIGNIFEYDKSMKDYDYTHRLTDDGWVSETILFKVMCSHSIGEIMNTEVEILKDNTEEIDYIGFEANDWYKLKETSEIVNKFINEQNNKINELVDVINEIKENKEEK